MDPLYELLGHLRPTPFYQDDSDPAALTCSRLSAELGVTATAGENGSAEQVAAAAAIVDAAAAAVVVVAYA